MSVGRFVPAQSFPTPYIGEIRLFAGSFAPSGWALCNGQLLSINQNMALFSLLGTTYGGDGQTNFALPNLQGRVPIHASNEFVIGQTGGEVAHTITLNELPEHTHAATATRQGSKQEGTSNDPNGHYPAASPTNAYGTTSGTNMATTTLNTSTTGNGIPVNNMQPYLVVSYIIALQGVYPSRY